MFCIKIASFCFKTGQPWQALGDCGCLKIAHHDPLLQAWGHYDVQADSRFSEKSKVDLRECFKIS